MKLPPHSFLFFFLACFRIIIHSGYLVGCCFLVYLKHKHDLNSCTSLKFSFNCTSLPSSFRSYCLLWIFVAIECNHYMLLSVFAVILNLIIICLYIVMNKRILRIYIFLNVPISCLGKVWCRCLLHRTRMWLSWKLWCISNIFLIQLWSACLWTGRWETWLLYILRSALVPIKCLFLKLCFIS